MISSYRKASCLSAASALCWTLSAMAWLPISGDAWAQQQTDIRLSRYTTGSAGPDAAQIDPLEAVVQVSFPRSSVATVGDALHYLLLRTGYRLGAPLEGTPPASAVLSMPLPEVHRQLGPYSVRTALSVLLGTPFALSVDPVQRQVSYRTTSPAVPGTTASVAEAHGAAGAVDDRTGSNR